MSAILPHRLEGTVEHSDRGLLLRDRDGMWWRLDCSADVRPYLTGTVRIAGVRTPQGSIEVWHVEAMPA